MGKKSSRRSRTSRKDAEDFKEAAQKAATGEDVSLDAQELEQHLDDIYGPATEAADPGRVADLEVEVDPGEALDGGAEAGELVDVVISSVNDLCRNVTGLGAEAVHGVARDLNAATGVASQGMPDSGHGDSVVDSPLVGIDPEYEGAENLIDHASVGGGVQAVGEGMEMGQAGETALEGLAETGLLEVVTEGIAEEVAETALDSVPGVGTALPLYNVFYGAGQVVVGSCGLVAAGAVALGGGIYGAVAAKSDRGASLGGAMNMSMKMSAWSASHFTEGTLHTVRGTAGLVSQVPGTQIATIPTKALCKMGATSVKNLRNSSPQVGPKATDDYKGAITKMLVKVHQRYQIMSSDGTRVLRATNTKSRRGYQYLLGHAGYSLSFDGVESAETDENVSSFSLSKGPNDTYFLHSDLHNNNTLFFIGKTYPAEWVVWAAEGKTSGGAWETLEILWQEGGKKFKLKGDGGQFPRWCESRGVFQGTRSESEGTEFVLREKGWTEAEFLAFLSACTRSRQDALA